MGLISHHLNPSLYPGPCPLALELVETDYGPPDPGNRYVCFHEVRLRPPLLFALVKEVPIVAGTYLLQVVHYRGSVQDVAVTTHHWRWELGTDPVDADFAAVESAFQTFWSAIASYISVGVTQREYRWYGPRDTPGLWGESLRVTSFVAGAGTASSGLPHQVACAVTETTDVRRRWGRFYIPNLGTNALSADSTGLFLPAFVTTCGTAASALLGADIGSFAPVVFGAPTPTSLPVRGVRVDRVPDVQRRRRYPQVSGTYIDTFA